VVRVVRVLVVVLAAGAVVLAGTARGQPSFTYDRALGALAREALWQALPADTRAMKRRIERVSVRCYLSRTAFEHSFELRFGISARKVIAYYAGGPDVHLRSLTCENVRSFVSGRHTIFTSAALSILLHESLHRQGVRNERLTTCFANEAVRWGAEWLGSSSERALRARNLAFEYTRRYSPPSYVMGRPTCLALARNRSWREFTSGWAGRGAARAGGAPQPGRGLRGETTPGT
jgi:hypothetical protein